MTYLTQALPTLPYPKEERKLHEASHVLILGGIPLHVFHPVLLFDLADGEQDVRFTPAQRNGGKSRHRGGRGGGSLPDRVTGEER